MNERDKLAQYESVVAENERLRAALQRALAIRHAVNWTRAETARSWAAWDSDARAALAACEVRHA